MRDVTNGKSQVIHDALATDLTPVERQSLARSRKVAFFVLAGCTVLGAVGALYFWYLWILTAKTCVDTYIVTSNTESLIIHPELATTLQSRLIGLDISSFSSLILALLFTRLAYGGARSTFLRFHRDGWSYFDRAYRSTLFTEGFETLCVRFGLLGTLLSFLLAAVAQLSDASVEQSGTRKTTMADVTGALAREQDAGPTAPAEIAQSTSTQSTDTQSATSQLSEEIFLLLCASLVSTFVGTGVAYTITPSLNWLNERAVGLHQLGQVDTDAATEEFFRQIDRTSQRLAEFDATTAKLGAAAHHMAGFEANVGLAAKRLVELLAGLERAIKVFEVSNQSSKQLAKKLDQLESMSDRMSALLDRLPERLNDPLKNMSLTAGKFREAAQSGEAAFRELKDMAGSARDSLNTTTDRTNTTWQMLREVQEGLKDLASNEETQTIEVSKLVAAFDGISDSLVGLVHEIAAVGSSLRQRQAADQEAARLLVDHRIARGTVTSDRVGNDGSGREHWESTEPAEERHAARPWWRRLFG